MVSRPVYVVVKASLHCTSWSVVVASVYSLLSVKRGPVLQAGSHIFS